MVRKEIEQDHIELHDTDKGFSLFVNGYEFPLNSYTMVKQAMIMGLDISIEPQTDVETLAFEYLLAHRGRIF